MSNARVPSAACALLAVLAGSLNVQAAQIGDGENPPNAPPSCLDQVMASFPPPSPTPLGQNVTLTWNVSGGGSCAYTVWLDGERVNRQDNRTKTVFTDKTYVLSAKTTVPARTKSWYISVTASLPPRDQYGRITVPITRNDQVRLFKRAVGTRDTTVYIASGVQLNLSGIDWIPIFPGVQIIGTRSPHDQGPLLFTTTFPRLMFTIGGHFEGTDERKPADNVRVTGIRLRGAIESVTSDSPPSTGIRVDSSINVEIDNNEIFGWSISAIDVLDSHNRIDLLNGRGAIRIRGNSIHHNQGDEEGYGIEVSEGAYALIERNVFNHNRHAIAGGGEAGTGYFAYRNVIHNTGGYHSQGNRTHQIDMHGQDKCWGSEGYCGLAGQYMDIRYNAILYNEGNAIVLRGQPTMRMDVAHNSFRHRDMWGGRGGALDIGAMYQSDGEPRIVHWDNTYEAQHTALLSICDFDGDGLDDTFIANGSSWWLGNSITPQSNFLNTSTLGSDELEFGDVNNDGRCDIRVIADGRVSLGGRTPLARIAHTRLVLRNTNTGQLRIVAIQNGAVTESASIALAPNRDVVGIADIDGDGDSDILARHRDIFPWPSGGGAGRPTETLYMQDGQLASRAYGASASSPAGGALAALADFDGNGSADALWRDGNPLELRLSGIGITSPTWRNQGNHTLQDWQIKASGDFNGDGYADIVWRHTEGWVTVWLMIGSINIGEFWVGDTGLAWVLQGVGDLDGNGHDDLLWRNRDTGALRINFNGGDVPVPFSWRNTGYLPDPGWQIAGVSDFNSDGKSDILWRHTNGSGSIWMMDGARHVADSPSFYLEPSWQIQGLLRD